MECRKFDITISAAYNVEDVRLFGKTEAHARIYIVGLTEPERRTPTDTHGKKNPAWNFTTSYTIFESMLKNCNTVLVVKVYCTRAMGDIYIGQVDISLKELFDCAGPVHVATGKSSKLDDERDEEAANNYDGGRTAMLTLPLQKGSVKSQGALRISYSFTEKVVLDKLRIASVAPHILSSFNKC
ncbi:PREDICTED: uncharacterized protein LOC105972856 [Erythranthe guttata]|nr:PREDICTED: uncharacterized protein LOC105972856 [Erythranthe guttata]|eukprot:XP_012853292.1 PREDICTED: uncharacterized protein LOC105972856 [Erythranthe guttata]